MSHFHHPYENKVINKSMKSRSSQILSWLVGLQLYTEIIDARYHRLKTFIVILLTKKHYFTMVFLSAQNPKLRFDIPFQKASPYPNIPFYKKYRLKFCFT